MLRFRLHQSPSQALPLNVRSAGHYHFAAGQQEIRPPGEFLQIFWSVAGEGTIRADKRSLTIRPGAVFLYHDGETHELSAGAGAAGWEYRWLTLDGEQFRNVAKLFGLRREQMAGPCPVRLFEELDGCLQDPTAAGERRASVVAYEILLLASLGGGDEARSETPRPETAQAAKAWLDDRFTDSQLNVSALAEKLRVHRASLHRAFVKSYGVAPVQYLRRLRLRLALELLASTRIPIAEAASRCGLPDTAYFSKLVARSTGYSPRAYRLRNEKTAAKSRPS